eukprot:CAMPEP_0197531244 /NCGR_PEP_ID=MMETSP1318-20131121/34772_1 /TAXON_ID=552666 /ORGANISM="Partenskyella glossopodia, Strain RCC365" /LENGTH=492 /DNA_ID=CAMNT_0043087389 /DNA_START=73 /DNA_END=1551 /DNA_ORIENTATION=-
MSSAEHETKNQATEDPPSPPSENNGAKEEVQQAGASRSGGAKSEGKKDFRAGDWLCKMCQAHNFASRNKCFKCAAPRDPPSNFKMGDWMCPLCAAHNYRSKRNCFKCGGGKPQTEGRNGIRPGDWICLSCGAHNFKDKLNCFNCFTRKPFMAPQMGQFSGMEMGLHSYLPANFKPGDWMCPQCAAHNYQSRTACFKCNAEKPANPTQGGQGGEQLQGQIQPVSQLMMAQQPNIYQVQALLAQASLGPRLPPNFRPGDWMCPSCAAHNYRSRESCFKCSGDKPKSDEAQQLQQHDSQQQQPPGPHSQQPVRAMTQPGQIQGHAHRHTGGPPSVSVSVPPMHTAQSQMQNAAQMRSIGMAMHTQHAGQYSLIPGGVMPSHQQMPPMPQGMHAPHVQMQPQPVQSHTHTSAQPTTSSGMGLHPAQGGANAPRGVGIPHFSPGQWRGEMDSKKIDHSVAVAPTSQGPDKWGGGGSGAGGGSDGKMVRDNLASIPGS